MTTVTYYLDLRKANKKGAAVSIIAEVSYKIRNKPTGFKFSTGLKCGQRNFDKQLVHGREPNAELKNESLKRIKAAAETIFLKSLNEKSIPSTEDFKAMLKVAATKVDEARSIIAYFQDYIESLKAKQKSRSFVSAMVNLKDLLAAIKKEGKFPVTFATINSDFETKFRQLLLDRQYKTNTVSAWVKRLKIFMNWAAKRNLHTNQLFKLFEMAEESKEVVALTEMEVDQIAKLPLPVFKHIEGGTPLTRDWFIISTQTALRFSDFKRFREAELLPVLNGYDVKIRSQKTNTDVVIPITSLLYSILKSYGFEMPLPPSNQKYNEGLKRIAKKAGITKNVSSHTGRKTFCTTMYKRGTPVPSIMKISGHKTEKEFYKYIGVSLTENAAIVRNSNPDFFIEHETKMSLAK